MTEESRIHLHTPIQMRINAGLYAELYLSKHKYTQLHTLHGSSIIGTKKYEYKGKKWHEQCFNCNDCKGFIGSNAFIYYKKNPVCLLCYDNKYALHCAKCQKVCSTTIPYISSVYPSPHSSIYGTHPSTHPSIHLHIIHTS